MNRPFLFAIALSVPILFLGAVTEEGLVATTLVVLVVSAWIHTRDARNAWPREARVAALALSGVGAFELLQLVPLPATLLRLVSPRAAALWTETDLSFGREVGWHPISLDLHATSFMAATTVLVTAFFITACRYALRTAGRIRLVRSIIAAVLLFDAVAIMHEILGLEKLYGVFGAGAGASLIGPLVTPLINPNHAAALSAVGPPLLLGVALEATTGSTAAIATVTALAASVVCVLNMSRGGMAVLACEIVALGSYAVARRSGMRRRIGGVAIAIVTGVGAVGAATYVALEPLARETRDTNVSKLKIVSAAARMIPDFWLVGIGRGAFTSTFAAYEDGFDAMLRYTHVESWPVQLAVDLGLPVAIAFVVALAWAVGRCMRTSAQRPVTFGALVALAGLALHDLVDFSMEFGGVAMVAAALVAVVLTSRPSIAAPPSVSREPLYRWLPSGLVILAPLLLIRHWHHDVQTDTRSLAEAWGSGQLADAEGAIIAAADRHPADPYFPMIEGIRRQRSVEAAPFLLRAVKLGPSRPSAHFWLARWFVAASRQGQAWAEYHEALRLSVYFQGAVLDDMITFGAPNADIIAVADTGPALEDAAARLVTKGRLADAALVDDLCIERFPPAVSARVRRVERAVVAGQMAAARRELDELIAIAPDRAETHLVAAKVASTPEQAEAALVAGLGILPDSTDLLEELIRRRGTRLGLAAVDSELARLRAALIVSVGRADRALALQGQVELARGRPAAAIAAYIEAASSSPNADDYLETAAGIAESSDQLSMAESLYVRLLESHPQESRYSSGLARVRERIARRLSPLPDGPMAQ